ncbi:MAG: hypothetical protein NT027_04195 [Proteobacteria bacterium]|nr:hypothetical protein [Pseudomonadota bacterium]
MQVSVTHLFIIAAIALTSGCRTAQTGSTSKDVEVIRPVGEDPDQIPNGLTLVANLDWLTTSDLSNLKHTTLENGRDMGPKGEISLKDFNNFYRSYWLKTDSQRFDLGNCLQLAKSKENNLIVLVHAAPCESTDKLMSAKTLRFHLIVDDFDARNVQFGFGGFKSFLLRFKGYHVGAIHSVESNGKVSWYLGDLCSSPGAGRPFDSERIIDDSSPAQVCNITLLGQQILDLNIRGSRSDLVNPVKLKGFAFEDPTNGGKQKVESICFEETAQGIACHPIGTELTDACLGLGLKLLPCRGCETVCEGRF